MNDRAVSSNVLSELLSRFLDTEYNEQSLMCVSNETYTQLVQDIQEQFPESNFSADEIKQAWKSWFEWAAYNGAIVSPQFRIIGQPCAHAELEVLEQVCALASKAIDTL